MYGIIIKIFIITKYKRIAEVPNFFNKDFLENILQINIDELVKREKEYPEFTDNIKIKYIMLLHPILFQKIMTKNFYFILMHILQEICIFICHDFISKN